MKLAWSALAVEEMRELGRYSIHQWGKAVATRYVSDVRVAAKQVATRPDRARLLRGTLRLVRVRSHYLIVNVDEEADVLTVARVLHTAMDLERHLPKD